LWCRHSLTAFNTTRLGDRNLHMVNIALVPHWFQHAIGKTKDENVLYSLFAEIMVNEIDLMRAKDPEYRAV
jgi:hypothetical protein